MKAYLKNYRQSPRKTRLVANTLRGKSVTEALTLLDHTGKRATGALRKLLASAVANATHNDKSNRDDLFVKSIRVDEGPSLKRIRPVSRGAAHVVKKRTSSVLLELGLRTPQETAKPKKVKAAAAKK